MTIARSAATFLVALSTLAVPIGGPLVLPAPASAEPVAVSQAESPGQQVTRTDLDSDWMWQPTSRGWAIPLSYFGWGTSVVFSHTEPVMEIDLPNAPGHRPTSIEFTVEVSQNVERLELQLLADGQLVDRRTVEGGTAAGQATTDVRFDIPSGANETLSIVAVAHDNDSCPVGDHSAVGRLVDPVLFYGATQSANPSARRDMFTSPEVVTSVEFVVEEGRSDRADEAVLIAAAELSAAFDGAQRIAVRSQDDAEPRLVSPFALTVEVAEREQASTSSIAPGRIRMVGRATELHDQATGLSSALVALNTLSSIVVERAVETSGEHRFSSGRVPLADLPGSHIADSGARHLEVVVPLEQATFGQPVASFQLRLGGVVSPAAPADLGGSQLNFWVNDQLLEVISVDDRGRFDFETTIDGPLITRSSTIRLTFDADLESCAQRDLYNLQLDAGSWVAPTFGQVLPPGLDRFPQSATPGLAIYPGSSAWELALAAEALAVLQEHSTTAVPVQVISKTDVAAYGGSLLVVGADVEMIEAIEAPINARLGTLSTGTVQITSDDALDYSFIFQGFLSPTGANVLLVDGSRHEGRGGLPDGLASRALDLFRGSTVMVEIDGTVSQVAGTQQLRADTPPSLLALDNSPAGATSGGNTRKSFALGLGLAVLAGGLSVLTRPLRRRRIG